MEKLILLAKISHKLSQIIGEQYKDIEIYRSKGLLAHLLKQKHFVAAKYLDYIPEIINNPDYAGITNGRIELVKCFKDKIFISIKLDQTKNVYYVATIFDVRQSKIDSYCKSGRLKKL